MSAKDEISKVETEIKTGVKKAEAKISAEVQKIHAIIEAWFAKHFHGNKISGDTDSYNIAHAAKEDLKTIMGKTGADDA